MQGEGIPPQERSKGIPGSGRKEAAGRHVWFTEKRWSRANQEHRNFQKRCFLEQNRTQRWPDSQTALGQGAYTGESLETNRYAEKRVNK